MCAFLLTGQNFMREGDRHYNIKLHTVIKITEWRHLYG
jgi:hypothetical protein